MQDLYTNRNSKKDFVQNAISLNIQNGMEIFIASAFFTEINIINMLAEKNCHTRLIFRLGFPTSPKSLKELLLFNNVEARFFTGQSFHPKIYIFGDKHALVGSANLTHSALTTNQEVVVGLDFFFNYFF